MAKVIIDRLLYNTATSEKIFGYSRVVDEGELVFYPGRHYTPRRNFDVYRTKKGRFFEVQRDSEKISALTSERVEYILQKIDTDEYMQVFKVEVPEA